MLDEWKTILKKPLLWVTMLGIALIPALYNVIFLSSMWDPYGKVDQLPVAVVNQDKPVDYQNQSLSIGEDMVDSMSKSKDLDYHFVSQSTADKGLKKGDYFMIVTLPKDLSRNAASLLSEQPKQMTISYQTSKGHSFIASKMADSAMSKLKASVSENITYTYISSLFKSLSQLSDGLVDASDGGEQLVSGTQKLEDGSKVLSENLTKLTDSGLLFSDGVETFSIGLGQYANGVSQLVSGTTSLGSGLISYTNGVDQLAGGANQLDTQSPNLLNGVTQLNQATSQIETLVDGANQLTNGLIQLSSQVTLSAEKSVQIQQLSQGLVQLNDSIQSIGTDQINISDLSSYLANIATNAQQILDTASLDSQRLVTNVQATAAYQSLSADQQAEIIASLGGQPSVANEAQEILNQASHLQSALSSMNAASQQIELGQLQAAANQLLPIASSSLSSLSSGMTQVSAVLNEQIIPGSQQVAGGVSTLHSQLSTGAHHLQVGVEQYTSAVSQLSQGANLLSSNSSQLVSGTNQVHNGLTTLDEKSSQLTDGANQLVKGTNQFVSGSGQLAQGSLVLTNGLSSLKQGASSLQDGLATASDKLSTVGTTDDNAVSLSSPVRVSHQDRDEVKTNGVGMAPYMMSVALMVAALSCNMIFSGTVSGKEPEGRLDWISRKLAVNGLIAILSATLLYFAVHLIGLTANNEWKTYLLTVLASATFMAMVTALYTWHERFGAFASIILLLLQLASCAGTYPLPLTDTFFQSINPFLPMSYSVSGLRQTISITGEIGSQVAILSLFLLFFIALGASLYTKKSHRLQKE